jgi:hypothetical protein
MEQVHVLRHLWGNTLSQMSMEVSDARGAMPNTLTIPNNVGETFLSREESLLLNELMQLSLERQSQGRNSKM